MLESVLESVLHSSLLASLGVPWGYGQGLTPAVTCGGADRCCCCLAGVGAVVVLVGLLGRSVGIRPRLDANGNGL